MSGPHPSRRSGACTLRTVARYPSAVCGNSVQGTSTADWAEGVDAPTAMASSPLNTETDRVQHCGCRRTSNQKSEGGRGAGQEVRLDRSIGATFVTPVSLRTRHKHPDCEQLFNRFDRSIVPCSWLAASGETSIVRSYHVHG